MLTDRSLCWGAGLHHLIPYILMLDGLSGAFTPWLQPRGVHCLWSHFKEHYIKELLLPRQPAAAAAGVLRITSELREAKDALLCGLKRMSIQLFT